MSDFEITVDMISAHTTENNGVRTVSYTYEGCPYNIDNKPNVVVYYKTGTKEERWYDSNGNFEDRHDVPNCIFYYAYTHATEYRWYNVNGKFSRADGLPNCVVYCINGTKQERWYNLNGKLSRVNGLPSYILYNQEGIVQKSRWYDNGLLICTKDY